MFLQLDTYIFDALKVPQSWGESSESEYAQIPIIAGKPVVQRVGEKLQEVELSIELRWDFCVPEDEIAALQVLRRNGTVCYLTTGSGVNLGRYVITSIQRNNTMMAADGMVYVLQAVIKLLEYNTTGVTTSLSGKAYTSNTPPQQTASAPLSSLPGTIVTDVSAGITLSAEVLTRSTSTPNYGRLSEVCSQAVASFAAANAKVSTTKKVIYRAVALKSSLVAVQNALLSVQAACTQKNYQTLMSANTNLEQAVYFLKGASCPVAAFIASREGGS